MTPTDPAITIRAALPDDAPAYQALRLTALRQHQDAFMADYEQQAARPAEYWQENLNSHIDNPGGILYFAVADQRLVGMIGIRRTVMPKQQHSAYIWGVYVNPDWRGRRIADSLIDKCLDWAGLNQVRVVKLGVIASNASAIRCYLRCGFTIYGVEPEAISSNGAYHDELLMVRRLV